jgi:hypothetical protein
MFTLEQGGEVELLILLFLKFFKSFLKVFDKLLCYFIVIPVLIGLN